MRPAKKPHGEIRQSQLVTTFGPGSMVDLPNHSVLVAGLDFWSAGGETISEPRLARKLARCSMSSLLSCERRLPRMTIRRRRLPESPDSSFRNGLSRKDWRSRRTHPFERGCWYTGRRSRRGSIIDRDKKQRTVVRFGSFGPAALATSPISTGTPSLTMDRPTARSKSANCSSTSAEPAAI